jgi:hypothetical protein
MAFTQLHCIEVKKASIHSKSEVAWPDYGAMVAVRDCSFKLVKGPFCRAWQYCRYRGAFKKITHNARSNLSGLELDGGKQSLILTNEVHRNLLSVLPEQNLHWSEMRFDLT